MTAQIQPEYEMTIQLYGKNVREVALRIKDLQENREDKGWVTGDEALFPLVVGQDYLKALFQELVKVEVANVVSISKICDDNEA